MRYHNVMHLLPPGQIAASQCRVAHCAGCEFFLYREGTIAESMVALGVQDARSEADFERAVHSTTSVAVYFWAAWCVPCKQLDVVFAELAKQYPGAAFLRVEAEELSEVSLRYNVSMVPHFLLLQEGRKVAEVEGADAAALTSKVGQHFRQFQAAAAQRPTGSIVQPSSTSQRESPAANSPADARLKDLLSSAPVLLCMKGTPEAPQCGFSAKVVGALREAGVAFKSFNILTDEAIRQGLKEYSNWPTYPQLYANGELLGGCDIVLEMHAHNQLKEVVDEALGTAPSDGQAALNARLRQLIRSHQIMLFMKGTPDQPRCGFSSKVVAALRKTQLPFGTFDILQDEAVRQGLKEFSDWPTYPQVYAGGEFIGGCDLITELDQAGDLQDTLEQSLNS